MSKIKVGIIGAAGYTAGELIRILIQHPDVEISYVQSDSNADKPIDTVHKDLFFAADLKFCAEVGDNVDVAFLCKGHGESVNILRSGMVKKDIKIIDLSQDSRLNDSYPDLQKEYVTFIYGLPELNKSDIRQDYVSIFSCFIIFSSV